uniref:Uncharacterized protein n=1 Tax=Siphoviridae sp. ct5Px37 TaxID=2826293 RepID=A0A8S5N3Y2_9CAUD|nr:MAG TPA: hypothetical protein [Siphoviridae sp. ct5Px37]
MPDNPPVRGCLSSCQRVRRKKKKGLSCILLGRLSPDRPVYQEVPHSGLTRPVSAMG